MKHKYVRKGLVLIGALKDKGNSIKKSFLDKSRKHKGKTCLKKRKGEQLRKVCMRMEFDEHFTAKREPFANGLVKKTYSIDQTDWIEENGGIFGCAKDLIEQHIKDEEPHDVTFQWVMTYTCAEGEYSRVDAISSRNNRSFKSATQEMSEKLNQWCGGYKDGMIKSWDLVTRQYPEIAGQGSSARTIQQASKKWFIFSPNTVKNCGIAAFKVGYHATKEDGQFMDYYQKKKTGTGLKTTLCDQTKKLKKDLKKKHRGMSDQYADEATLTLLAKHKKCDLIVYNSVFQELWTIQGSAPDKRTKWRAPVELQLVNEHFVSLIRWKDWNYQGTVVPGIDRFGITPETEQKKIEQEAKEEQKDKKIYSHVKVFAERSHKLAAWDIEASPDDNQEGCVKKSKHFRTYAVGFAWKDQNKSNVHKEGHPYKAFWATKDKPNVFVQWLEFLYDNCEELDDYTLYAHNGAKFDFNIMMKEALSNHGQWLIDTESRKPIEQNSAWINVSMYCIKNDKKCTLHFRDSMKMLAGGLDDILKDFGTNHQKLPDEVSHSKIAQHMNKTGFNVESLLETYPKVEKYLLHDVVGLLEAVDMLSADIFEGTYKKTNLKLVGKKPEGEGRAYVCKEDEIKYEVSFQDKKVTIVKKKFPAGLCITKLTTGAKLAKENFFLNYYDQRDAPLYKMSDDKDEFVRSGYSGGRVECLYQNGVPIKGPLYYYDFTSHFPAEGRKPLPYDKPVWLTKETFSLIGVSSKEWTSSQKKEFSKYFGFVDVEIRTVDRERLPLHAVKDNGRLLFPIIETPTTINLFSEEMRRGLENKQYEYVIKRALKFKAKRIMKKAFEDAISKKAKARKQNKPALAETYKILANSLYGVMGQRTKDMETTKTYLKDDPMALKHKDDLVNDGCIGNYHYVRIIDDLPIKDNNVAVAAAITSWARIRLFELMDSVKAAGGNVLYCDSDSMICNLDVQNTPKLQKEFMFDLLYNADGTPDVYSVGDALGSLKNECFDKMKKLVKKGEIPQSVMDHHLKEENHSIFFDEAITYQAKFYGLRKTLVNGYKVEICKCKGYKSDKEKGNKLTYDMLLNPTDKVIKNSQYQFRIPKSSFVNESNPFGCSYYPVHKTFQTKYKKGNVDEDGFITPLVI